MRLERIADIPFLPDREVYILGECSVIAGMEDGRFCVSISHKVRYPKAAEVRFVLQTLASGKDMIRVDGPKRLPGRPFVIYYEEKKG